MTTYGERIKQLRTDRKISMQALGDAIGTSAPAVFKWEKGQSQPDFDKLLALANYFGVTTDYLLGRTDDPGYSRNGDTVTLYPLEDGHIKKDAPISQNIHSVELDIKGSDLPTDRAQLETLVQKMIDQALSDRPMK